MIRLENPAAAGFFYIRLQEVLIRIRIMTSFDFQADPFDLFTQELERAIQLQMPEPHAMSLATVSPQGQPHVRTVLYKGYSQSASGPAFRFFTNYDSEKARDLQGGRAALLFHWAKMEQQVRVEGLVEKLGRDESEDYFKTRPRLSQLGAWTSQQSDEIPSFEWLEQRFREVEARFAGQEIPCPPNWGGYRVIPLRIEFWFGRPGRLHERYVFEREQASQAWRRLMRSP